MGIRGVLYSLVVVALATSVAMAADIAPKSLDVKKIKSLERFGDKIDSHVIGSLNWSSYQYCPDVRFQIAHDKEYLYIKYSVVEQNIKAEYLNDGEAVWRDSCVEIFIQDSDALHYHNFEFNCIGTLYSTRRLQHNEEVEHTADERREVIRIASLPKERIDKVDNSDEWTLLVGIPFKLIGYDAPPKMLKANLYKCGDRTTQAHFVSWSEISAPKPSFHEPQFFGTLNIK